MSAALAGLLPARLPHRAGIEPRHRGERHRIDFPALTGGRSVMVDAQTEVGQDLIALQLEEGGPLLFGAEALAVEGAEGDRPRVRFRYEGREDVLECDHVVGVDLVQGDALALDPDLAVLSAAADVAEGQIGVTLRCEDPAGARHLFAKALDDDCH